VERHDLDPVALVLGAAFVVLGLAYVIGRWTWLSFDSGWVLAAVLIALGLAGVVTTARRATEVRSSGRPDQPVG